jgi:large subunit ribosomal protein L20
MTRVRRGAVARISRKKVISLAKGAKGSNSRLFRISQQHVIKSLRYAYRGRIERKRKFRSVWVVRLNAISRVYGWNYSTLSYYMRKKKYLLNRKTISQLSIYDPKAFQFALISICLIILLFKKKKNQTKETLPATTLCTINYKNVNLLRQYIGTTRKILPRRITKLTSKDHRIITKAIYQSRFSCFLPSVWVTS